ncbi:MAG: DALR anticodon-binding domain-containing protein [Streptosporangiaceae bacterium]
MILADLDRELAARIARLVADGTLPPEAARIAPGRTWHAAPDGYPASFATSVSFELAALADREPADIAVRLAAPLAQLPWVAAAERTGGGYLTITVTPRALAEAAVRLARAELGAAASTILAGTTTTVRPWPDPAAAPSWRCAWQEHAEAMTGRLAQMAGASVTDTMRAERQTHRADVAPARQPSVADAVSWFGAPSLRYALARATPRQVSQLGTTLRPGAPGAERQSVVRQAHASAVSTLRWAAELRLDVADPGERCAELLRSPAEQTLLGMLPWLPVRVAAAAARRRPDELPAFLEAVAAGWLAAWQAAPALPFGGQAAPADPATAGARLMLATAVTAVLASGLALTGAPVCAGDD